MVPLKLSFYSALNQYSYLHQVRGMHQSVSLFSAMNEWKKNELIEWMNEWGKSIFSYHIVTINMYVLKIDLDKTVIRKSNETLNKKYYKLFACKCSHVSQEMLSLLDYIVFSWKIIILFILKHVVWRTDWLCCVLKK